MKTFILTFLVCYLASSVQCWGSNDKKVRLQDVQVLTLHQGKMTTGRRSSPVPQLNCVGGSAKGIFNPQVVQCYNRGWDGMDVQWECKTDLDMDYRLGSVNVICEGYDYPEDPYILAGSCGLEYTLELTQAGRERNSGGHKSYNNEESYSSNLNSNTYSENKWKGFSDLILFGVVCIVIYAIYKTCIDTQDMTDRQYSSTNNDGGYPSGGGAGGWSQPGGSGGGYHQQGPGQPGYGGDASCGAGGRQRQNGTGAGAGNFWTGAGLGGLMGYMFGARNNTGYYNRGYNNYGTGGGWGGNSWGWGGGGGSGGAYRRSGGFSSGSTAAPRSSGTRTASGFGGTTRR